MSGAGLREAIQDLHQYLSDRIAPLMVADSMGVLVQAPASLVAGEIDLWASQQQMAAPGVPAADFLYHAVKKIALVGELDLVDKNALTRYIPELAEEVLPYCPEGDRELLRQNLARVTLAAAAPASAAAIEVMHRQSERPSAAPPPALTPEAARGTRRMSLFLERLQPQAPAEQRQELASQFVATAAVQSRSAEELQQHLEPLRAFGIEPTMKEIFRTLAQTLPGWGRLGRGGDDAQAPLVGAQLEAMRHVVALAEDAAEASARFRELVHAAVEQFNEGHLGRAVTMYVLAERLAGEGKVPAAMSDPVRKGHELLSAERLKKYAERSDTRTDLRSVMGFYFALRPEGLLEALNGEPDRQRRHELLALLEAHEGDARADAHEMLRASVENPESGVDPFFQMNLVYLLRVIPRPEGASVEDEVELVTRAPARDSPAPLVKQVIAYLGFTRHEKSERALISYLRLFENMLLQPETALYSPSEVETLLDRTCAALARYGGPRAWRALVDHGLKTEIRLGSPTARLVEAGKQDLSSSPELVDRLIVALKQELPRTVLGFTVKKNDDRIVWIVQALSGTPTPEVRAVLEDIAQRYPAERFGDAAAKAAATLGAESRPPVPAGLSGDLGLFGLPGLLQTLSQSQLTGVISLMNAQGRTEAAVLLEQGRFRGAQYKHLKGVPALYQLLEQPFPGTFAFVARNDVGTLPPASPPKELIGLILEGVRRHDDLKRATALAPDDAVLDLSETPPSPPPDEELDLIRAVWERATSGNTAAQIEAVITRDSFQVRRLLAHWVEEGALKIT